MSLESLARKLERDEEKKNPQGRPKWVPEGAVEMVYDNPKSKKGPYTVWIELNYGERNLYLDQRSPALYAVNIGWLLKKYLRAPGPETNEFGVVSP